MSWCGPGLAKALASVERAGLRGAKLRPARLEESQLTFSVQQVGLKILQSRGVNQAYASGGRGGEHAAGVKPPEAATLRVAISLRQDCTISKVRTQPADH